MNAQQQMVYESEFCCAVLGRGEEFLLIDLSLPIEDASDAARANGLVYVGCLAVKDGKAGVRCEPGTAAVFTMLCASMAFAQLVADRLRPEPQGDAAAWLDALYSLPDTRG